MPVSKSASPVKRKVPWAKPPASKAAGGAKRKRALSRAAKKGWETRRKRQRAEQRRKERERQQTAERVQRLRKRQKLRAKQKKKRGSRFVPVRPKIKDVTFTKIYEYIERVIEQVVASKGEAAHDVAHDVAITVVWNELEDQLIEVGVSIRDLYTLFFSPERF